jgi:hypothetical protein
VTTTVFDSLSRDPRSALDSAYGRRGEGAMRLGELACCQKLREDVDDMADGMLLRCVLEEVFQSSWEPHRAIDCTSKTRGAHAPDLLTFSFDYSTTFNNHILPCALLGHMRHDDSLPMLLQSPTIL